MCFFGVGDLATISVNDVDNGKKISHSIVNHIENHYGDFLKVSIAQVTGHVLNLEFHLKSELLPQGRQESVRRMEGRSNPYPFLNPRYTFDTFVVGKNNDFAHAGALAAAESPGQVYNPLFIYGGVGLGKTHLMHSIAWYIAEQNPKMKILYTTSEDFTRDVVHAIMTNKNDNVAMEKLRKKYRTVDLLLIDDIQFIIGKESTQEEFFHTFNTLKEANKQIVISGDRPPKELKTLEERLRSRFEQGLIADIGTPDYETRMAILKNRKKEDRISIDDAYLDYIATNITANIRELDGAFTKLVHHIRLKKVELNQELVEEALKDIISPNSKVKVTFEYIMDVVSEHFNISPEQMLSSKKNQEIAYPRQICMYLCRELLNLKLGDIAKKLGKKDHSTVIHGYNKIRNDIGNDEELRRTIDVLIKKINPQ